MAQPTLQDVADRAGLSLNDDAKTRWPDSERIKYVNDGLACLFDVRPDMFVGQFVSFTGEGLASGDPIPVNARFLPLLADYVVFRAERKDVESSVGGHVSVAAQWFKDRLA